MSAAMLGISVGMLLVWAAVEMRPPDRALKRRSVRRSGVDSPATRLSNAMLAVGRRHFPVLDVNLCEDERRCIGLFALLMFPALVMHPLLGIGVAALDPGIVWHRRRSAHNLRHSQILHELPLMVELMSLLVGCGYNVTLALRDIVPRLNGPLATELNTVLVDVQRGDRLADALDRLPERTCDEIRPFVWSLTSTERYGAPLGDVLDRLSLEARTFMANRAEQAARKLTVQLLFPVAVTTLPAFALLTVAPFVVSSFRTVTSAFN